MLTRTGARLGLLRPTATALMFPGMGGGSSGGTPSFQEMFARAREQHQAQQQQSQGALNPFAGGMGGGGALNPFGGGTCSVPTGSLRGDEFIDMSRLQMMQQQMQQSFTPEMRQAVSDTISGLRSGNGPQGGMGMMAFGVGENENGKRVAKAAKVFVDTDGNVTKEYKEHQIDPDDMLPKHDKADANTYNYEDATEVRFEEDGGSSSASASGRQAETISEMEVEFEPAMRK